MLGARHLTVRVLREEALAYIHFTDVFAAWGEVDVVVMLLSSAAMRDVHLASLRDSCGSPLLCVSASNVNVLRALEALPQWPEGPAERALVNSPDACLRTPLHWAAGGGDGAVVHWLLCHGADAALVDCSGNTAATLARMHGFTEVTDLIAKFAPVALPVAGRTAASGVPCDDGVDVSGSTGTPRLSHVERVIPCLERDLYMHAASDAAVDTSLTSTTPTPLPFAPLIAAPPVNRLSLWFRNEPEATSNCDTDRSPT